MGKDGLMMMIEMSQCVCIFSIVFPCNVFVCVFACLLAHRPLCTCIFYGSMLSFSKCKINEQNTYIWFLPIAFAWELCIALPACLVCQPLPIAICLCLYIFYRHCWLPAWFIFSLWLKLKLLYAFFYHWICLSRSFFSYLIVLCIVFCMCLLLL